MPAILTRILDRLRRPATPAGGSGALSDPVPFGPHYVLDGDRVTVESGPLAGTCFRVERNITDVKADFALFETAVSPVAAEPVAHSHFDRDPGTGTETFWDIFIRAELRGNGLSTLLVRLSFRELLGTGRRHWFAIRKLMQVDSESERHHLPAAGVVGPTGRSPKSFRISLHNLGVGMVALHLGFRPEPDLDRMLSPGNIEAVQVLTAEPPVPPGLLFRIRTQPGLVVAALIDPDTNRPVADAETYQRFVSPRNLLRQAMTGQALIGNINYVLPRAALGQLAARLADDRSELKRFVAVLQRGSRN